MIGVFDPKTGASGDMVLGCLLDLVDEKEEILDELLDFVKDFCEVELALEEKIYNSLLLTNLDVVVSDDSCFSFEEIKEIIIDSDLKEEVKNDAIGVFQLINEAEENVHGKKSHFHEVGQADALVDVVGSALAFNALDLDKVYCTPISVGGGYIDGSHGQLGAPAPATVEVLKNGDLSWRGGPVESELLTPTGAALLAHFVDESTKFVPELIIEEVSRATGSREIGRPNYLSLFVGKRENQKLGCDDISVIETNVDDVDGEVLGFVKQKLMEEGALDVSIIPLHMKKDRSGYLVKVLCHEEELSDLSVILAKELGSLGVRVIPNVHRYIADREKINVSLYGKDIDVKVASFKDGEFFDFSAEFDDCKRVAESTDVSLKEVRDKAEALARKKYE